MNVVVVLLCSLLVAGCTEFPVIEAGECGNAVKEAGEDCDTFASSNGALCRSPGQLGECRHDCSRQLDGTRRTCPANQGCDSNGVCREASGAFDQVAGAEAGAVAALLVGDFDADGRSDVLSRAPADALLQSKFRLHYFDDAARLSETRSFPKSVAPPVFRDINGDAQDDLIFSDLRVGVLLGRRDRRWVPQTFSSYRVPGAGVRMVGVHAGNLDSGPSLAILTTMNGQPGVYVPDSATSSLGLRAPLVREVEDIAGEVVAGDLIEGEQSPCDEVLFAYRGASELSVYELCEPGSIVGMPRWLDEARKHVVRLPSNLPIDAAPIVVDVDGDQHLDVLIGAEGRPYLARGDGVGIEAVATLFLLSGAGGAGEMPMPLAAGDFTADGVTDFVFASALLASTSSASTGEVQYAVSQENRAEAWTVARIADLNGNGEPDVVTASNAGVGVHFFSGTGTRYQVASSLPTAAAVRDLVVGDFDGDLIQDVAFLEASPVPGGRDSLKLAFGGVAAVPSAPVQVAEVPGAEAVSAYNELGIDSLAVASRITVAGSEGGAVTLLDGSADRLPFAPYALVSFARDGSIAEAEAVAISVGSYTAPTARDVLALGARGDGVGRAAFGFWLLASVGSEPELPRILEGTLSPRLSPVSTIGNTEKLRVASASADVDGDAIEESLWLMPADGGARCGLSSFNVSADAEQLNTRELVLLEEPCAEPSLASGDMDGDGFSDIVVSLDGSGETQRTLRVLWNDGRGGFASSDSSVIAAEDGSSIRAFSLFDVTHACGPYCSERLSRAGLGTRLGYVTEGNVYVTQTMAGTRSFGAPALVRSVSRGSALTVGDVDGDGLLDMVVADAGTLTVFKAQLKP